MGNKYIAVDILQYAKQLVNVSKNYCEYHQSKAFDDFPAFVGQQIGHAGFRPMNLNKARDFLTGLVEDLVNGRVMYPTTKRDKHEKAKALFDNPVQELDKVTERVMRDFYSVTEVAGIYVDLFNLVAKHVELNTWDQWTVLGTGNTVSLIQGRDFRVVEWENITGYRGEDNHVLELDLTNVLSYLKDTVNKALGSVMVKHPELPNAVPVWPGNAIDFKPMIKDVLEHLYPKISFDDSLHITSDEVRQAFRPAEINECRLAMYGITNYGKFRDHFIKPAIESFSFVHLTRRLDTTEYYIATLDNFNQLTIDFADASQWRKPPTKQTELEALAESLLAGDWLLEKDRVRAERFILERGY